MIKQEQSEKIVYGSLITSTKCYNCIHFPLCFAQKGGANLELASENDCCYYQSKLPENSVVLSREEYENLRETITDLKYDKFDLKNEISEKDNKIALLEETIDCIKFNVGFVRKETAREILNEILFVESVEGWEENEQLVKFSNKIVDKIEELANKYGVEAHDDGTRTN